MKDTRNEIIDIAEELIRTKGYNAFSYTDISKLLKIKNASIHYHFPSKSDLGIAVIKMTIDRFLDSTTLWKELSIKKQFTNYISTYEISQKNHWVCLMGALSSSYDTLPDDMKKELSKMGNIIIDWLTDLLEKGKRENLFSFTEDSKTKAYLIQTSLIASLLLDKVLGDNVYNIIKNELLKK